jgi:hypothetical protein
MIIFERFLSVFLVLSILPSSVLKARNTIRQSPRQRDEPRKLLEEGFEYLRENDDVMLFRKRK